MPKDAKGHGSNKRSGPTFWAAKAHNDRLDKAAQAASDKIRSMSGGGKMGMTPDSVKNSPAWRRANAEYQAAHAAHRAHNQHFLKEYGKEIRSFRDAERMAKVTKDKK